MKHTDLSKDRTLERGRSDALFLVRRSWPQPGSLVAVYMQHALELHTYVDQPRRAEPPLERKRLQPPEQTRLVQLEGVAEGTRAVHAQEGLHELRRRAAGYVGKERKGRRQASGAAGRGAGMRSNTFRQQSAARCCVWWLMAEPASTWRLSVATS
ncbi:hypothetical protein T492DRAFT_842751 [Pavlovales sp. CCMP2436]|nr:hypothetical protein T492DRAFT_842751 [Pavlovales sp. CCMP2436]